MKILVTGGTGFIGKALLQRLVMHPDHQVSGSTRTPPTKPFIAPLIPVGPSNSATDWSAALQGVDVVIHVAAHLNTRSVKGIDPLIELRRTNVDGTLAQCASLQVDSGKARQLLGWTPRLTPEDALFKSGRDFRSNASSSHRSTQENKAS